MYNINYMIDKKSKILLEVFFLIIIVSIIATYYQYLTSKNFTIFIDEEAFNESLLEE